MLQKIFSLIGTLSFSTPWMMTGLFVVYYAVLGVLALKRPVAGVIMYYGTSIMNPQFHYPLFTSLPMAKLSAGVCLMSCLINARKVRFSFPSQYVLVLVFWIFSVLCTIDAINPDLSSQRFSEFNNIGIILLLILAAVQTRDDVNWLFWGVLGCFWFGVMKNLVETQTLGRWYAVHGTGGWLGDSNDWALALSMSIPLFYASCFHPWIRPLWLRIGMGLTLMSALLVLTITSSRGAFLATAAAFGVLMLTERKKFRALCAMAALGSVVIAYMPASYMEQIFSIIHLRSEAAENWGADGVSTGEYTGTERVYFWRVAMEIMRDHPFSGVGWGNFIEQFALREGLETGAVAHSTWFQIAAEAGAIALSSFVTMILYAFLSLWRAYRRAVKHNDTLVALLCRAVMAGLVAFGVGASFISRENSELLFLYVAFSAILSRLAAEGTASPVAGAPTPAEESAGPSENGKTVPVNAPNPTAAKQATRRGTALDSRYVMRDNKERGYLRRQKGARRTQKEK